MIKMEQLVQRCKCRGGAGAEMQDVEVQVQVVKRCRGEEVHTRC